ncbi:hypothetical protein A3H86_01530 [Candidatus Roizmanbacteria bacterium RIFCSPLOWO2_02_FULL_41_9]|uniref:Uncharacterized protein n=2 Tax=Candidatus Roizmaniibacteriota TaxID=1752723 RepID=A0A1F7JRS4_9BACT|nr:MAG: hypothetical protein A3H86_01530 [Candidatus Roizmanbacteria bacterium RIFCSPLOWO2_02_FULL_41_9]
MGKRIISLLQKTTLLFPLFIFAVLPQSSNYMLKSYEFGGGGAAESQSANYKMEGAVGDGGNQPNSSNYQIGAGLFYQQMASMPTFTVTNTSNWYNKLEVKITNTADNGSDAQYAFKVTYTDSGGSPQTKYIQSNNTLGDTLYFQTYASWGGASGFSLIGLASSTTYIVYIKARQGGYTEGPYSSAVSASTVGAQLSFDIDIAPTDQSSDPPYAVSIGSLNLGSVTTATDKVWISFATNADYGGVVWVKGANGGLTSLATSHTITSVSGDLSSVSEGYGAQGSSATQTSGGQLSYLSPYDGSGNNVGIIDTTLRQIFLSVNPITGGRGSFLIKVKTPPTAPAATDYAETLTLVASGTF